MARCLTTAGSPPLLSSVVDWSPGSKGLATVARLVFFSSTLGVTCGEKNHGVVPLSGWGRIQPDRGLSATTQLHLG